MDGLNTYKPQRSCKVHNDLNTEHTIIEYMSQVSSALHVNYFCSRHEGHAPILDFNHMLWVNWLKETWPTCTRVKFCIWCKQWKAREGTDVHPLFFVVMWITIHSLSCKGSFCPFFKNHMPAVAPKNEAAITYYDLCKISTKNLVARSTKSTTCSSPSLPLEWVQFLCSFFLIFCCHGCDVISGLRLADFCDRTYSMQ